MAKAKYSNKLARPIPLHKVTIERLESIVSNSDVRGECYLHRNKHHTGYSHSRLFGQKYPTHRIIKVISLGEDDQTSVIDHLCRNTNCIRVSHLEFVSFKENVRRGISADIFKRLVVEPKKAKTHCINGHELNEVNCKTFVRTDGNPGSLRRSCRVCHKLTERKRRASVRQRI